MATVIQWHAILGPIADDYPLLQTRAHNVYSGLSGNQGMFVDPIPQLPTLQDKIKSFDVAQQDALARIRGAAAVRNVKARELVSCLGMARSYVQSLADADPDQGYVIITTAGMLVRQQTSYHKPELQAVQSKPGGPVRVIVNVGVIRAGAKGQISFNWQYTADGGKTFINLPSTPVGATEVSGLTQFATYGFRASVSTARDTGPWTQVVSITVF